LIACLVSSKCSAHPGKHRGSILALSGSKLDKVRGAGGGSGSSSKGASGDESCRNQPRSPRRSSTKSTQIPTINTPPNMINSACGEIMERRAFALCKKKNLVRYKPYVHQMIVGYHNNPLSKQGHLLNGDCHIHREFLERLLGFPVRDLGIYTEAFTHKSGCRVYGLRQSFERLEFLGDSVISLITTRFIFEKYHRVQEGFLTRLRTKIVSGKMLSEFALQAGLQHYILMDAKALSNRWNLNRRILEDVFEALVGAIYLDVGLEACKHFFLPFLEPLDFEALNNVETNMKDLVMRWCQARGDPLPTYRLLEPTDPKVFRVEIVVRNTGYGPGQGATKKDAEQDAARIAVQVLGIDCNELRRR
jgi:ribonuclease-3